MSENNPELSRPAKRQRRGDPPSTPRNSAQPTTSLPQTPTVLPTTPCPVLTDKKNRKNYRNGFEVKPKTPSFKPDSINNQGHPWRKAFAFRNTSRLAVLKALSEEWNTLALDVGAIKPGQKLQKFQVESTNIIISRSGDLCVIAPTGAGKSLIWILPLLIQKHGISLVIIPFTSLGYQGEDRYAHKLMYISSSY
jgi:hypothetical protein